MSDLKTVLLESWDRQATIINNLANLVQPDDLKLVVAEGEWPIGEHLCHIHGTRRFWMRDLNPDYLHDLKRLVEKKKMENGYRFSILILFGSNFRLRRRRSMRS